MAMLDSAVSPKAADLRKAFPGRGQKRAFRPLRAVSVLEEDLELAGLVAENQLAAAKSRSRAAVVQVPRGTWQEPEWPPPVRQGLGLLILGGLMLRRLGLDGRCGAELVTKGDLLRPWQGEESRLIDGGQTEWRAIEPTRIAVLDIGFARRVSRFPEIYGEIAARAIRRSRHLTVNMAIVQQPKVETRLLMTLWHLADRCGTIDSGGSLVPIDLSHTILAELVAARRPTVSTAIASIQRAGKAKKLSEGWELRGGPPGEMELG